MEAEGRRGRAVLTAGPAPDPLADPKFLRSAAPGFHVLAEELLGRFPDAPAIGSTAAPGAEPLRFAAHASLGFPAGEIAAVEPLPQGGYRLRVNFLGLYGPSSPLPPHVTERILHAGQDDERLAEFLDLFNHRLVALTHLIWRHRRYYLTFARAGADRMSDRLAALIGLPGLDEGGDRLPPRAALFPFAGLFALFSRSGDTLIALVRFTFGVPARLEEFVAREVTIPEDQRVGLGTAALGETFLIGAAVRDVAGKFRLHVGPLGRDMFHALLPGEEGYQRLGDLVRLTLRDPLDWDLALEIAEDEVPAWQLGSGALGWSLWSGSTDAERVVVLPAPPEAAFEVRPPPPA